jgi:hypothetical protein
MTKFFPITPNLPERILGLLYCLLPIENVNFRHSDEITPGPQRAFATLRLIHADVAAKVFTKFYNMQTRTLIILLWGLLTFIQSVSGQTGSNNIIRIKSDFANAGPVKMSELFSEIRYIPLEDNPNCLLGYMSIAVFGKSILVRSADERRALFRFSDQGIFLNKIGNQGRGPTEYLDASDVRLIGDTVFIVSSSSSDIKCYSLTGNFLKSYHLNINSRPTSIVRLPDNTFMVSLRRTSDFGRLIKTNKSFNIQKGFMKNRSFLDNGFSMHFRQTKKGIYYYDAFIDTIFDVSRGYPIPAIIIDHGKYSKPPELFSKKEMMTPDHMNYPIMDVFMINDYYIVMDFIHPQKMITDIVFYRLSDGKTTHLTKFVNDIDKGAMEGWLGYLPSENNLIFTLMPTTIKQRFDNMTASEKRDPKNSRFVEMASKITLESNPVLMICKLK